MWNLLLMDYSISPFRRRTDYRFHHHHHHYHYPQLFRAQLSSTPKFELLSLDHRNRLDERVISLEAFFP